MGCTQVLRQTRRSLRLRPRHPRLVPSSTSPSSSNIPLRLSIGTSAKEFAESSRTGACGLGGLSVALTSNCACRILVLSCRTGGALSWWTHSSPLASPGSSIASFIRWTGGWKERVRHILMPWWCRRNLWRRLPVPASGYFPFFLFLFLISCSTPPVIHGLLDKPGYRMYCTVVLYTIFLVTISETLVKEHLFMWWTWGPQHASLTCICRPADTNRRQGARARPLGRRGCSWAMLVSGRVSPKVEKQFVKRKKTTLNRRFVWWWCRVVILFTAKCKLKLESSWIPQSLRRLSGSLTNDWAVLGGNILYSRLFVRRSGWVFFWTIYFGGIFRDPR